MSGVRSVLLYMLCFRSGQVRSGQVRFGRIVAFVESIKAYLHFRNAFVPCGVTLVAEVPVE